MLTRLVWNAVVIAWIWSALISLGSGSAIAQTAGYPANSIAGSSALVRQDSEIAKIIERLPKQDLPVIGRPVAPITIYAFLDYQCVYCKGMARSLIDITRQNPELRILVIETPVLGEASEEAAIAALAAAKQGRYEEFHIAVMEHRGRLTPPVLTTIAEKLGLDLGHFSMNRQAPEIAASIRHNLALAEKIGLEGTPSFLIGDHLIFGAVPAASLVQFTKDAL